MFDEHIACTFSNRAVLDPALSRLNARGRGRVTAHYHEDEEVIGAALFNDFGLLCPRSVLSLYQLQDRWEERRKVDAGEIFAGITEFAVTPVVFLMNPDLAAKLDVFQRPCGWRSLVQAGGEIRIRHASFNSSDGLAVGIAHQLALQNSDLSDFQEFQKQVEEYGPDDQEVIARSVREGEWRTDLVIAREWSVLDAQRKGTLGTGVIVYPQDGTLGVPVALASISNWYSPGIGEAFERLSAELLASTDEDLQAANLHRDLRSLTTLAPVGNIARAVPSGVKTLQLPSRQAVRGIRALASQAKRAVDVILLFDMSSSMEGAKIHQAKDGLNEFLRLIDSPQSRVSLISFGNTARLVADFATIPVQYPDSWFKAEGQTALYDAVDMAITKLETGGNGGHLWAIVGLTDGQENNSSVSLETLRSRLSSSGKIRFYGIAYGAGAGLESLRTLADACDGMVVSGDIQGIKAIYERLSTYV